MQTEKQHTYPCSDCLWRRRSIPGKLGIHKPEFWLEVAKTGRAAQCHEKSSLGNVPWNCTGLEIFKANIYHRSSGCESNITTVFETEEEFLEHHAHKERL